MVSIQKQLKNYYFPIILFSSILLGGLSGYLLGPQASRLKPLGDIFLNLIFTAIVPLIFFSVAAAIARMSERKKLWKVVANMMVTFIFTGIVAAIFMIIVVKLFPPGQNIFLKTEILKQIHHINLADQIVSIFTVSDFTKLFSHNSMLPLICFSVLVGLATSMAGEKGKTFSLFLESGNEIFMKIISLIMYYAPVGFFAYFAVLFGELGHKLLENYLHIAITYYVSACVYFVLAFSFYAYLANRKQGVKVFWKNIFLPMLTSLATCSSTASIPANLLGTKNMGVPSDIYETVIPLGAVLHKDGSVLGAILKIAFLFGLFNLDFSGILVLLTAIGVGLLVGSVMGAIPSGGMLGEMLILSLYGFPNEALMMIAAISIIIDPLATMLNVTGDSVCCMMVARLVA